MSNVSEIHIYNSGPDGQEGATNVWRYQRRRRARSSTACRSTSSQFSVAWPACNRNNSAVGTQSVGVSLTYTYDFQTPFRFVFGNGLTMTDRTVMQLNPTN